MLRRHVQTTLLALGAALSFSACAAPSTPAAPSTLAAQPTSPAPAPDQVGSPSSRVTVSSTPAAESCSGTSALLLHQAPELEAVLPTSVQGRSLARWSVRGRCWPERALQGGTAGVDDLVERIETPGGAPINLDNMAYAEARRTDTSTDPPYYVSIATRPLLDEDEINLTLILFFGSASYHDVAAGIDPQNYKQRTIAGKEVLVGTEDMLDQNDNQRGRPYFYETIDYMFFLITDDDAWAADALGQLP